jgi:truncated hemoglobin YjbI
VKFHYRLAKFFKNLTDEQLVQLMKHLLTYSVGGRRAYRGRDMKNAHEYLQIKEEHFLDMKHLVRETFKELGVVDSLILQVLKIYDDKRRYVVSEKKDKGFSSGEESLLD